MMESYQKYIDRMQVEMAADMDKLKSLNAELVEALEHIARGIGHVNNQELKARANYALNEAKTLLSSYPFSLR